MQFRALPSALTHAFLHQDRPRVLHGRILAYAVPTPTLLALCLCPQGRTMQTSPAPKPTEGTNKTSPCCRLGALWGFAWLCWLTAVTVDVFVTPGGDWLRHNDNAIEWFTVGGGDETIFGACDVGLLSSQWCSYCE